jgi:hypothetical protein
MTMSQYEDRPLICRNTTCINKNNVSEEEQHHNVINEHFIKIKKN